MFYILILLNGMETDVEGACKFPLNTGKLHQKSVTGNQNLSQETCATLNTYLLTTMFQLVW